MTQANIELLNALKSAGADEALAEAAARSVAASGEVATKADLAKLQANVKAGLAELKAWLAWRLVAALAPVYALLAYLAIRLP